MALLQVFFFLLWPMSQISFLYPPPSLHPPLSTVPTSHFGKIKHCTAHTNKILTECTLFKYIYAWNEPIFMFQNVTEKSPRFYCSTKMYSGHVSEHVLSDTLSLRKPAFSGWNCCMHDKKILDGFSRVCHPKENLGKLEVANLRNTPSAYYTYVSWNSRGFISVEFLQYNITIMFPRSISKYSESETFFCDCVLDHWGGVFELWGDESN